MWLFWVFVAQASEASSLPKATPDSVDYETVITGSRSSRLVGEGATPAEVIRRSEIEAVGAENLSTALDDHPGLDVSRTFAGAGLRIQGLDPQYVLILVDGERITGRVNGTVDLSRFVTDDIERVEILRGPSGALWGSDALGGVVNIITRRAKRRFESDAHVRYGFGSSANPMHAFDANAKVATRLGGFNVKLTGGIHRANPFDLDPRDRATTGNGYTQYDVSGRGSYRFGSGTELAFKAEYLRRDQNGIDVTPTNALLLRANSTETFLTSLSSDILLSTTGTLRALVAYSLFRDQFLIDQRGSTTLDEYNENWQHLGQAQLVYNQRFGEHHTLTVGAEAFYERNLSARLNRGFADRVRSGAFIQDEWLIVKAPLVMLTPAIRIDGDTAFGAMPTPKIAFRVDPVAKLSLRLSYGWGYRAPSFQELYLQFNNASVGYTVQGNPGLRPEISQALNAGLEYTPAKWFTASLNFYRNDLENLIGPRATTASGEEAAASGIATIYTYTNISHARTQGLESLLTFRPIDRMAITAGYTLLDAMDLDRNRRLDGRATHRGNFGFNYTHERTGLSGMLRGSVVSDRVFYFDQNGNDLAAPLRAKPYVSLDVRVQKTLGRFFDVFAGVDNIANAGTVFFLPITPRIFYAGLNGRY
jgi:outer membrane receptor for ferrienterochelin and colicins